MQLLHSRQGGAAQQSRRQPANAQHRRVVSVVRPAPASARRPGATVLAALGHPGTASSKLTLAPRVATSLIAASATATAQAPLSSKGGASPVLDAWTAASSWAEELERLSTTLAPPPTFVTATGRVVAIGDLHGDWTKTIDSFKAAGVIEVEGDEIKWTGEDTVVVQLGDVLDRGDNEIAIVNLLRGLDQQAREQGGAVYMINGNHESLNVCGDYRYVTPGAMVESALFAGLSEDQLGDWELLAQARFAVYRPGGPMALELSKNPTVLVVNDTIFAHGGLLPIHVSYGIEALNSEVSKWMRGEQGADGRRAQAPLLAMGDGASIMWNRAFSRERYPTPDERAQTNVNLGQVLQRLEAKRMVVGHTPQLGGANCEFDGRVWRVDVGMSSGVLNRPVQVLEISKPAAGSGEVDVRVLPKQVASLPSWSSFSRAMGEQRIMSRL